MNRASSVILLSSGVLLLAACGGGGELTGPAPVASVAVTPAAATVVVGATVQLTATAKDAADNVLTDRTVTWTSSNAAVATVSGAGLVTGAAEGRATITATSEGQSGEAAVTVNCPAPVASVTLTPRTGSAVIGGTVQLNATVKDSAGSELAGCTVTWASSDPAVATVSGTGLVTGVAEGSARITATGEGQSGTAEITVTLIRFAALSAGNHHTCGVTTSGAAYCWGGNYAGELGNGTTINSSVPTAVLGGLSFADVSPAAGGFGLLPPPGHTCGVATSGEAYCWGPNYSGQLGSGSLIIHGETSPVAVVGGLRFATVSEGERHTCAVTADGAGYCWGANYYGELGNGSATRPQPMPVAVVGGLTFAAVSAGATNTCGRTTQGTAYCWGSNFYGELGNGGTDDSSTPVAVAGGLAFASLSTGGSHSCGVAAGAAFCWGYAAYGQLGNGGTTDRSMPVAVMGGLTLAAISAGLVHTCGITTSGAGYCWGGNFDGQLGNGSTTASSTPVPVAGGLTFAALTGGDLYTCGLTSDGVAYCWGFNGSGRLGNGTTTSSTLPVKVAGQPRR